MDVTYYWRHCGGLQSRKSILLPVASRLDRNPYRTLEQHSLVNQMSFLPIIKDIIPLIMPSPVHITKSSELSSSTGQTDGMIRQGAIIGRSASICGSLMTATPHSASAIHHHGGQDTIVYAVSGRGAIVTCPKGEILWEQRARGRADVRQGRRQRTTTWSQGTGH